jgi:uncharacterized protein
MGWRSSSPIHSESSPHVLQIYLQTSIIQIMKIAVLSDSHDHVENLRMVVTEIKGKVEAVIFCGDFCAPFMPAVLKELNLPVYACPGNNDEDQIGQVLRGGDNFHWTPLANEYGEVELDGKKIAFCHYPKLGELLAGTGDYDAVFYGHTHDHRNEKVGNTLLVNPGAVCGIQKGKYGVASYAIYDTSTNTAEIITFTP